MNARVSLMAARLLDEEALKALASGTPQSGVDILGQAGLAGLVEDLASGRYIEQSIVRAQLNDLLILMRAAGDGRGFLQYWAMRFEMTNLKAIIRGRVAGRPAGEIRSELTDLGFMERLPVDDLLRTEGIDELLRRLEATPYADMVRFAHRAFEAQPKLFDLDAALDRRYYHGLCEMARPIEAALGQPFHRIMALYIDRTNLIWLLRFLFDYRLPAAQVYYLLIPSHYRLSSSVLKELVTMRHIGEVLAALPEPYRGWLEGAENVAQVHVALDQKFASEAQSVLRTASPAFARAFAYLLLRDRNLRRVRAIIKGQNLGLSADVIAQAAGLEDTYPAREVA